MDRTVGWIIDLYPRPGQMIVWLKQRDGTCARLVDRWKPRIYVGGEFGDLLNLVCEPYVKHASFVEKTERAVDQFKSRVLEIEVKSEKEASILADKIQRAGSYSKFRLYNVDIPFTQMYLYEKDLFPLAHVEAENEKGGVKWTIHDSREAIDYQLPPLRQVKLSVKTAKSGKIRTFDDELQSIEISHDDDKTVMDFGDESYKLLKLVDAFKLLDPDVIVTDDGDSFLFPYLARRAQVNGISDRLILDREGRSLGIYETQGHSYFSYGKILYRQTAARLLGRVHIDRSNAFFIEDCGLEGLFEVARTCIIPVQRCSRTTIGTSMTSLQLYHAVKQDVLIPYNKNEPEEFKDGNELLVADRGGFIFEPKVGIHDDIGELDFSSLYPMIMLKHNLSGETVKCKCCPDSADRVPELGYNICEKWTGIVPRSLDILLRKRMLYKKYKKEAKDPPTKLRYDQRQAALKWILVCS
jgi:DNA polymerase elongation subunit (family B)